MKEQNEERRRKHKYITTSPQARSELAVLYLRAALRSMRPSHLKLARRLESNRFQTLCISLATVLYPKLNLQLSETDTRDPGKTKAAAQAGLSSARAQATAESDVLIPRL